MNGMRALSNFVGAFSAAAMMLSTTLAVAQPITPAVAQENGSAVSQANADDDDRKRCKYIRAEKGGGSEIVPPEKLKADDANQFPYLSDDSGLRPENQVDKKKLKGCGFFLFGPQFASAGPGAAGGAAAGGAATGAGLGAGVGIAGGTIAAGAVAVGLGAIAVGVGLGLVSPGGKPNQTSGPVCTTNCNGTPQ